MKRKISLIVMMIFLFNIMPIDSVTKVLGFVEKVNAETMRELTREDVTKFEGGIAINGYNTVILNSDGTVNITGFNYFDQANVEIKKWRDIIDISAGINNVLGIKSDGTVVAVGDNYYGQCNVESWSDIVQVSAGYMHSVGLKSDGTVVAVGNNYHGQLNVESWSDIVQISSGMHFTVGLKSDGTVVAVGDNYSGQLNVESWRDIVQVAAGGAHTIGLKRDGTVVAVGWNSYNQLNVENWTNIVQVSAGYDNTVGLKSDGTVVSVGNNKDGELNINNWGNIVNINTSKSFTNGNTLAIKSDGAILIAGDNRNGQANINKMKNLNKIDGTIGMKNDGTIVSAIGHSEIESWKDITNIKYGGEFIAGIKSDGEVLLSDDNKDNGLGYGEIASWNNIIDVAIGSAHIVGLKKDGTLIGTGCNDKGEINLQDAVDVIKIAAGFHHTVGLLRDGTVRATGWNYYGQCDVSDWSNVIDIGAGVHLTVALKNDGTVLSRGDNRYGQRNLDDWYNIKAISVSDWNTVGLKWDGTVVAVGNNDAGQCNVSEWKDIKAIYSLGSTTVGLKKDGTIVATGWNEDSIKGILKPEVIVANKNIVKPMENIKISISPDVYYKISDNNISVNKETFKLNQLSYDKYELNYSCSTSGIKNIYSTGFSDVFGNPLIKQDLFRVIPLQSITTNKSQASNGEKITITATFTEPVKSDFTVDLTGAVNTEGITLKEIPGTNGLKYAASYIIPNSTQNGDVNITIKNLTDNNGVYYNSYTEENVFSKIPLSAPVDAIELTSTQYKIGDYIAGYVRFNKDIDYTKVRVDLSGAINVKDIVPGKGGPGGVGFQHYVYANNNLADGPVTITVKNIYDATTGVLYGDYVQKDAFNLYALTPQITSFKSSVANAKLGDVIRFSATFNKVVKNNFNLSLNGQINLNNINMSELENSNGKEYYYDYKVSENDLGTINQVTINSIEDLYGNTGYSYINNVELCNIDGQVPKITSVEMDNTEYRKDDLALLSITVNEAIKSGVKATLLDGDTVLQELNLDAVQGSNNKSFEAYFSITSGATCDVNVVISKIEDNAGNVTEFKRDNIFKILGDDKPVITGADNLTIKIGQAFIALNGVQAVDKEDGDIANQVVIEGLVDVNKPGQYKLIYKVTDSYGSTVIKERIITVEYWKEDVNKDNFIDALDLAKVAIKYGVNDKDTNLWDIDLDINNDGIIDIFDLVYISRII